MRLAILSDVHANLEALTEVERTIAERGVDLVVSLGDVVGYGASPNECCEILRRLAHFDDLDVDVLPVAARP